MGAEAWKKGTRAPAPSKTARTGESHRTGCRAQDENKAVIKDADDEVDF
jgi:hypothetical protein